MLEVRLLGAFEALWEGKPLSLGERRSDRLLAYFVLHPWKSPAREIEEALWPNQEGSVLRKSVGELREALGNESIEMALRSLTLQLPFQSDVTFFDEAIRSEEAGTLLQALEAYRGPLLSGWQEESDTWIIAERLKRRDSFQAGLLRLCRLHERDGDLSTCAHHLRMATEHHPEWLDGWRRLYQLEQERGESAQAHLVMERYRQRRREPRLSGILPEPEHSFLPVRGGTPKTPSGALSGNDTRYVARAADTELYGALQRGEYTILLKGPRASGKSSALARALQKSQQNGHRTLVTDLSTWDEGSLQNLSTLCDRLAQELLVGLEIPSQTPILAQFSPSIRLTETLRQALIHLGSQRLIWSLDGVDSLFGQSYQDTFFSQLRAWHSQHAYAPQPWSRLTQVLLVTRDPHLYISDLNQSPFNIGTQITLDNLSQEQAFHLFSLWGNPLTTRHEQEAVHRLLGGRPALLQRALSLITRGELKVEALLEDPCHPFTEHLERLRRLLSKHAEYREALRCVLAGQLAEPRALAELRSLGILQETSPRSVTFTCELYRIGLGIGGEKIINSG